MTLLKEIGLENVIRNKQIGPYGYKISKLYIHADSITSPGNLKIDFILFSTFLVSYNQTFLLRVHQLSLICKETLWEGPGRFANLVHIKE